MINKKWDEKTILRFERIVETIGKHCVEYNLEIEKENYTLLAGYIQNEILNDKQILEIAKSYMKPKSKKR